MNSQSMGSLLSNLLDNNHYRFQKHRRSGILNHTLFDLTTGLKEIVDDSNSSSSDGSDVIVRSESNVITIDVDLSTKESVINVGTQTNVVQYYRCEEAIAAITRLTHFVQTLSSRVDISSERLTGQLNLALDAIISHRSQVF